MQRDDAAFLLEYEHGLNWSEAGTGKTMTSVCVIEQGEFKRVLVICPKIAVSMWGDTLQTQLGMKVLVRRTGTTKAWEKPLNKFDAVVTTFAIAASDKVSDILREWLREGASIAILDEAHYCKSKDAKRARAILAPLAGERVIRGPDGKEHRGVGGVMSDKPGLAISASYILQLTGTPMTRYPDDFWMQLAHVRGDVLDAYKVKGYRSFVQKFCTERDMRIGNGRVVRTIGGAKNLRELNQLLNACQPLRRTLEEVAGELPPLLERWLTVEVSIPKEVRDLGEAPPAELVRKLQDKDSMYAKAWHDIGLAKVDEVAAYVSETYAGKQVLVGFWHRDVGKALSKALNNAPVVDGSTSSSKRDAIKDEFNAGKIPVLLGQIKAMGVSWNLQEAAHNIVVAETLPSRADLDQFIARLHRRGQENRVQVDYITAEKSIDQGLIGVMGRKQSIEERIMK